MVQYSLRRFLSEIKRCVLLGSSFYLKKVSVMNCLKLICLTGIAVTLAQQSFAQEKPKLFLSPFPKNDLKKRMLPLDSLAAINKLKSGKNILPYTSDVVMINLPKPIYQYNNQRGFDVYKSPLDGMAVLMPDKSFASNMPVSAKEK